MTRLRFELIPGSRGGAFCLEKISGCPLLIGLTLLALLALLYWPYWPRYPGRAGAGEPGWLHCVGETAGSALDGNSRGT